MIETKVYPTRYLMIYSQEKKPDREAPHSFSYPLPQLKTVTESPKIAK
jgi:hypothetical protein